MSEDAPSISPRELYDRLRAGDRLGILDVRDRDEFETWHVEGPSVTARQVPYVRFVAAQATGEPSNLVPEDIPEPIVAVCGVGEASGETAAMLHESGMDAMNLEGGMDAWATLVVAHEVDTEGMANGGGGGAAALDVVQYERPSTGCLSYLVAADGSAVLVDPIRASLDRYIEDVESRDLDLVAAVDTHVHADHLSGILALADRTGARVVLPDGASGRGLDFDAELVSAGEELDVGNATLSVVSTPGHTTEHVALDADGVLFTGDALFLDGVGRPDLEDPDRAMAYARDLYQTLHETIDGYPDETLIAPGHVQPATVSSPGPYVDTLGNVRDRLGIMDLTAADFVDRVAGDMPPRPANHERIVEYNLGHATIDQSALELELGPNNCAIPGE